jgi:hypothetical protein
LTGGLSLVARDETDLALIAACLQDALVPLAEMRFDPVEQRFYMIANRFLWERAHGKKPAVGAPAAGADDADFTASEEPPGDGRRNAAIRVDHVVAARSRGIDLGQPGRFLSLLTVQRDGSHLNLVFAGGGVIQLEIMELAMLLRDLGTAWPTPSRPSHGTIPAGEE